MAPDSKHTFSSLPPIPTYEEATSSRPGSTYNENHLGPSEVSDDHERQGLLNKRRNYAAPAVESARTSFDSVDGLENGSEEAEVRREMQEMDIEEPQNEQRSLLGESYKRLSSFRASLQSLHSHLPPMSTFSRFLPSTWRMPSIPHIDWQRLDANRAVILGRLFGILIIGALIYVLFVSNVLSSGRSNHNAMFMQFRPDSIRDFMIDGIAQSDFVPEYLTRITSSPHIAGTEGNYVLGEWMEELFKAGGLHDVHMERFDVYLNYPRANGRRVAILDQGYQWQANIEEGNEETLVFHGLSANGEVEGPLVYANYGSQEDFDELKRLGIDVAGAIVLVRYYGTQTDRAMKVKSAELSGAIGCIIYSDPADDGEDLGPTYPDGRFMPADAVQRGTVGLTSFVVGDMLSPGFASTPGESNRISVENSAGLNKIPSIPLSWSDAKELFEALHNKNGLKDEWMGNHDLSYWNRNSPLQVHLQNFQDEEPRQPIYNILGHIPGWEDPTKRIIIGAHRDAWCLGGADPGSGTAVLLELVRQFSELAKQGWRPLRTIQFASWDAEEYNLIGSTEHVEARIEDLKKQGVAYINLDTAVFGTNLTIAGSPVLTRALDRTLRRIIDPRTRQNFHDIWQGENKSMGGLGAGSDHVAFQDMVGVSSIDLSFQGDKFPYHSCYDNYDWMSRFGDPDFVYHKTMAQLVSLFILELSDHALLPFDLTAYADALDNYIDGLDHDVNSNPSLASPERLDVESLRASTSFLRSQAPALDRFDDQWHARIMAYNGQETDVMTVTRLARNDVLMGFEKHLLDDAGIVNRTQFKHVIFGPAKWSSYDEAFFPGIRDWIDVGDLRRAQEEVSNVADRIMGAAKSLVVESGIWDLDRKGPKGDGG